MNSVQDASLTYTNALVWYHDMRLHVEASKAKHGSALREDEFALRTAYDEMVNAQNVLNDACVAQAMLNQ